MQGNVGDNGDDEREFCVSSAKAVNNDEGKKQIYRQEKKGIKMVTEYDKRDGQRNTRRDEEEVEMEEEEEEDEEVNKRNRRMLFWNVAGIGRQDREFWKYIEKYDYVGLCETWIDDKGWNEIKNRPPISHVWLCKQAEKKNIKGRACGGIIVGIRKSWSKENYEIIETEQEGMLHIRIKSALNRNELVTNDAINIIVIYNSKYREDIEEIIRKVIENYENERVIIGGDFNLRIGELGGDEEEGGVIRKSKDKKVGNGGKKFIDKMQESGLYVLNGRTEGDWEGECTFVGARGNTVIDYIFVNDRIIDDVMAFRIESRVDSDHLPLSIEIKENEVESEEERRGRRGTTRKKRVKDATITKKSIQWDEEAKYRENCEKIGWSGTSDEQSVDMIWDKLKVLVKSSLIYKERKIREKKIGYKDWWDRSCTKKKREVKRMYIKWKKGKISRNNYIISKKNLGEFLEKKRKEKRSKEEEELRSLKNESEVWRFINKKRNKKKWMDNNIEGDKWRKYFMDLLGGAETRIEKIRGKEEMKEEEHEDATKEEEINEEEICEAVKRMKLKKAVGIDEIPMEAWRFGSEAVKKGLIELFKRVWKEGKMPEEWRRSIIVPLYKRGDAEDVTNYRGISLLCSAYKIFAEILRRRLECVVETKNIIPESQAGFRKGRSTMDNIYILNHIIQREKNITGNKKVYGLFIDLKAAFDKVNRRKLWEIMKKEEVNKGIIWRLRKIYEDTEAMIKTKKGLSNSFKLENGVRQGCVLSPLLFNIYMADMDKEFEKRGIGGVALGGDRIWSLAYADDVIVLAKNKEALEDMMCTLKRFLRDREMTLSTEKSKVVIFNGNRNKVKEKFIWNKEIIEEVDSFKYLGFMFNKAGNYKEHIKELSRKGKVAAGKVWNLGERICKDDFIRREMLYKYLVQSVMSYGAEIWGWEEKKELEKIKLDYIRWIYRLDFCTPRYLIRRELGTDKIKMEWSRRAIRFEERISKRNENCITKKCWLEKINGGKTDLYSHEREKFFNGLGLGLKFVEDCRNEGRDIERMLQIKEKDIQRQINEARIREARYNNRYKDIRSREDIPQYLREKNLDKYGGGNKIRALIRIRCGNMEEDNKYWKEAKDRMCLFCNEEKDNLSHYIQECVKTKSWFKELGSNTKERRDKVWNEELGEIKGSVLVKLWSERERIKAMKNRNDKKDRLQ